MLTLHDVRTPDHTSPVALVLRDGIVHSISPTASRSSGGTHLDGGGALVLPGFVEPHLHLDKALLDAVRPNEAGTLERAIAITSDLKRSFDGAGLLSRGAAVLDAAVVHGTTTVRAQTDVDPTVGARSVAAMLELRSTYRDVVDVQVVAFPQEGIIARPGTLELLRESLRAGADVVGGCSYSEADVADCRAHVDTVFDLAEEFGVPVDIHADFADDPGDPRFAMVGYITDQTRRRGLSGRVTVSHLTSLNAVAGEELQSIAEGLAEAGVAVVTLPATDLHLGGRRDAGPVRRGITPVRALRRAGVLTAISSNNVRNAFTPFGNVDAMETGLLLAQTAHLGTPDDVDDVAAMISTDAARVVGLPSPRGVVEGAVADLVVVESPSAATALLDRAPRRYVIKRGRLVAETRVHVTRHFPVEHDRG